MVLSPQNEELKFEEYSTKQQLEKALESLSTQRHLVHIAVSVKISLQQLFPEATVYLFSFSGANSKFWICLSYFQSHWNYINIGCEGARNEKIFSRGFREFIKSEMMEDMMRREEFWVYADEMTAREALFLLSNEGKVKKHEQLLYLFTFPQTRYIQERGLPDGFYLDNLHENDIDIVVNNWHLSTVNEKEYMRCRLSHLSRVCVRDASATPVAWSFLEYTGNMIHTFVVPEYRTNEFELIVRNEMMEDFRTRVGGSSYCTIDHTNHSLLKYMDQEDIIQPCSPVHFVMPSDDEISARWFHHLHRYRSDGRRFHNTHRLNLCHLNAAINLLWLVSERFRVFVCDNVHVVPWCRLVGDAYLLHSQDRFVNLQPLADVLNGDVANNGNDDDDDDDDNNGNEKEDIMMTMAGLFALTRTHDVDRDIATKMVKRTTCPCGYRGNDEECYNYIVNNERRADLAHLHSFVNNPKPFVVNCPLCRSMTMETTLHVDPSTNRLSIQFQTDETQQKFGSAKNITFGGATFIPNTFVMYKDYHFWTVNRHPVTTLYTTYSDRERVTNSTLKALKHTFLVVYTRAIDHPLPRHRQPRAPRAVRIARRVVHAAGARPARGLDELAKIYIVQQTELHPELLLDGDQHLVKVRSDRYATMIDYIEEHISHNRYSSTQISNFIRNNLK